MFIVQATRNNKPVVMFKDGAKGKDRETMLSMIGGKEQDFGYVRIANPAGLMPHVEFSSSKIPLIQLINLMDVFANVGSSNMMLREENSNPQTLMRMMIALDEADTEISCEINPVKKGMMFQDLQGMQYSQLAVSYKPKEKMKFF